VLLLQTPSRTRASAQTSWGWFACWVYGLWQAAPTWGSSWRCCRANVKDCVSRDEMVAEMRAGRFQDDMVLYGAGALLSKLSVLGYYCCSRHAIVEIVCSASKKKDKRRSGPVLLGSPGRGQRGHMDKLCSGKARETQMVRWKGAVESIDGRRKEEATHRCPRAAQTAVGDLKREYQILELALEGATGLAMRRGGRQRRESRECRATERKQAAARGVELRVVGAREMVERGRRRRRRRRREVEREAGARPHRGGGRGLAEGRGVGCGRSELLCSEPRAGAVVEGAAGSWGEEVCAGCGALAGSV
jgi:hypothetical protein